MDEKDAYNQNEYHQYDLEYNLEIKRENSECWNRKNALNGVSCCFLGYMLSYLMQTSLSICKDHLSDKRISGIALLSSFFGYILTQMLGGILANRYGGENMLFLSAYVWSISTCSLLLATHVSIVPMTVDIIATEVLTGAAQSIHFQTLTSLLCKRISIENRNTVYSIAASGTTVGNIFCEY